MFVSQHTNNITVLIGGVKHNSPNFSTIFPKRKGNIYAHLLSHLRMQGKSI